jgi:hypothetical protein
MKLFVDTNEYRTEVEPKFNGTASQHYAACIQKANECLNNTLFGLRAATETFIENMEKHPSTAQIVKFTFGIAPVLSAGSDKELRESMANFVVQTEKELKHAVSVRALLCVLEKGDGLYKMPVPTVEAPSLSTNLAVIAG